MARLHPIVFLIDVDNTLLDNDGIQQDLKDHLRHSYGDAARDRYWRILEDLFEELGYRDYLGALQCYRVDYPFANRLFPSALEVLKRLGRLGSTVILSDGDVVFQPHKVERSGLADAVDGRVLIYIHKEEALDDVERRYPAERYVLVDDKLRILAAVKQIWGERVTTIFVRQGTYAHDPKVVGAFPAADMTIERIADLLDWDLLRPPLMSPVPASNWESTR
jgi:FMN phosphatase YigB (HAD superfamily)